MTSASATQLISYIKDQYQEADIEDFLAFSAQLFEISFTDEQQVSTLITNYQIAKSLWLFVNTKSQSVHQVAIHKSSCGSGSAVYVASEDKPFIVDSISALVAELGYRIKFIHHPRIKHELGYKAALYLELATSLDKSASELLSEKITALLIDIEKVTSDWQAMTKQTKQVLNYHFNASDVGDISDFFHWLREGNFIFLGYSALAISEQFKITEPAALGLCKHQESSAKANVLGSSATFCANSIADQLELSSFINSSSSLLISKSAEKANIHRHEYYDQITVKQYSSAGEVIALHCFIGLFSQRALSLTPAKIPYIKVKLAKVLQQLSLPAESHYFRKFSHILEDLPKREIFESSVSQLYQLVSGIYALNAQNQSGTFIRENSHNQQVSVLVYVAKDAFCTDLRDDIEALLCQAYCGEILSRTSLLNQHSLAQWHFIVAKGQQVTEVMPVDELVSKIAVKTKSWHEALTALLFERFADQQAISLAKQYGKNFSKSYREQFSALAAITDIEYCEKLTSQNPYQFHLSKLTNAKPNMVKLNIYSLQQKVALSESIPILENLGFRPLDEFSFAKLACNSAGLSADLYSYTLEYPSKLTADINKVKTDVEAGLAQIWAGNIENDGYNKLLLSAGLTVRQIVIIRSYGKYLRQLGLGYSDEYFQQALVQHPKMVNALVALFESRFALSGASISERTALTEKLTAELLVSLNNVEKIDHDRILRNFIAAICATVRTNFYQKNTAGEQKNYCSFKIRSGEIADAPEPKPYVETFIYSPKVEGVHLRFGPVSRGGLRWSDRQEDFRTEVLGLVKAQQVKNVVIVPQGAKGAFVPKQLPSALLGNPSRATITAEAIACYKTFISGLLDLTDNNTANGIVKPNDVVCFDGDDTYLVVAADKGTATFSDIANQLAIDHGFWLGDAFASGGSVGYDHKKMGITAKGAWVSVQRHFNEMNIDVQSDAIKVAGIGDMSGDVFGNGMLLSKSIELVAAFDHRDIFIDPTPNAASSFSERQRLFCLARSSWQDYNPKLISAGGGVFSRSLKYIPLSQPIKTLLAIDDAITQLSPDELIRYILTAQLDLLWFGGIGTYVKASSEAHIDIGDKANDRLRINGNELKCKVIGEGGNLGCSQLARIEFAKNGGRINTDAVDNSAGVNCSDNEVNIKILLNILVTQGKLSNSEREQLLEQMTDEVAHMVLKNNYFQAQALSLDEANSYSHFDSFTRLTHYLVNSAQLNRSLEFLPDDEELQSRSGQGLTRPELAVLMAYSKMDVHDALLKQKTLLADSYFQRYLLAAFPKTLVERYNENILQHPLAQPIIATMVANEIFNRGGIHAVREQTGASIAEIVKAFMIAKEIFNLDAIWQQIEQLEGEVSAQVQIKMMIEVQRFYRLMAIWFINHADADASIEEVVANYRPGIKQLQSLNSDEITLPFSPIDPALYQLSDHSNGKALVDDIHQLKISSVVFCDIVKTAGQLHLSVEQVLGCFCQLSSLMDLSWFIEQTEKAPASDHWSRLARFSLLLELLERREKLVVNIIKSRIKQQPEQSISNWAKSKNSELQRIARVIDDLKNAGDISLDKLFFANRQIGLLLS